MEEDDKAIINEIAGTSELIANDFLRQLRAFSRKVADTTGIPKLGQVIAINATTHMLCGIMADFAADNGRDNDAMFAEFSQKLHVFMNEEIARHSKSKRSFLFDMCEFRKGEKEKEHGEG